MRGLFQGKNFNPVTVGVFDEIESHIVVFVAYHTKLFVVGTHGIVVACNAHTQVELTFTKVVGLWVVFEPCQFEKEAGGIVGEINDDERAILGIDAAFLLEI